MLTVEEAVQQKWKRWVVDSPQSPLWTSSSADCSHGSQHPRPPASGAPEWTWETLACSATPGSAGAVVPATTGADYWWWPLSHSHNCYKLHQYPPLCAKSDQYCYCCKNWYLSLRQRFSATTLAEGPAACNFLDWDNEAPSCKTRTQTQEKAILTPFSRFSYKPTKISGAVREVALNFACAKRIKVGYWSTQQ